MFPAFQPESSHAGCKENELSTRANSLGNAGPRFACAVVCFLQRQMSAGQFYGVGLAVIGRDQFQ